MCYNIIFFFAASLCFSYGDETILLDSFSSPVHKWRSENDPVMGGKSFSTFKIEKDIGVWDGEVVDVPKLKAPGFIQMRTYDRTKFSDVSSCSHLRLNVKTNTSYGGYKVSFGTSRGCPDQRYAYGYKSPLNIPVGDDFTSVNIPFTSFSDCWDDATGAIIKTCEEDKKYCPDSQTLQNFGTMAIWGEGTDGVVHLQVKSIAAIGCSKENESVNFV